MYQYVFGEDYWIRVTPKLEDCTEARLQSKISKSCDFLRTCQQIHNEASPIFWGMHTFTLNLTPSTLAPTARDPYDLENLGSWITRCGIRSIRSRKKVRNLSLDVWTPTLSSYTDQKVNKEVDWWRANCLRDPSRAGLDALEGVKVLFINFDEWSGPLSAIPDLEDVPTLTNLEHPTQCPDAMSRLKAANTLKSSIMVTVQYLLMKLPNIERMVLCGDANPAVDGFLWFGYPVTALQPEGRGVPCYADSLLTGRPKADRS